MFSILEHAHKMEDSTVDIIEFLCHTVLMMVEGVGVYNSQFSDALPKEGEPVFLSFPDFAADPFTVKVEDQLAGDPPEIVLTLFDEPHNQDGEQGYFLTNGQLLFMEWPAEDGYHRMPVELTSNEPGRYATFLVTPSGAGEVFERRWYFRVASSSKAVIWGHVKAGVDATVVDLSEGGMRCLVDADTWPESRKTVDILLQVGDATVELAGKVVRYIEKDHGAELGIEFMSADNKNAAAIRRHLYDLQRSAIKGSIRK